MAEDLREEMEEEDAEPADDFPYVPFHFETFPEERSNINAQKEVLESACKNLAQAYLDLTTEVGMNDEFDAARGWNEKLRRYVKGNDDFSDPNAGTCKKGDPANNSPFVDQAMMKGIENFQVYGHQADENFFLAKANCEADMRISGDLPKVRALERISRLGQELHFLWGGSGHGMIAGMGQKILDLAERDPDKATAYGFHLDSDRAAHNKEVLHMINETVSSIHHIAVQIQSFVGGTLEPTERKHVPLHNHD
ncbi:unnamed protein product [Notodromas monacha]|uniref:Uncharacterized protein n=1 Tax=Notodromas monacha TaxID=399045 RepID=A0A7R9BTW5_9CRUS|nr:unnamed protein product [Notodromas monacha]CAG0920601.1 unnamed protein product [Notodromas monacha]